METILVMVSVLSTLAIVAIVLSVVVILQKLKGKIDVEVINKTEDEVYREIDNIDRRIDSRYDKLYDHIGKEVENLYREINNNQKVLLKD